MPSEPQLPRLAAEAQEAFVDGLERLVKAIESGDLEARDREIRAMATYQAQFLAHLRLLVELLEEAGVKADREFWGTPH